MNRSELTTVERFAMGKALFVAMMLVFCLPLLLGTSVRAASDTPPAVPVAPKVKSETMYQKAAKMTLLAMVAEDIYDGLRDKGTLTPAVDPRILVDGELVGYLTGVDATLAGGKLQVGEERRFYGVLVRSLSDRSRYTVVIRGTAGLIKWLDNGEFLPTSFQVKGVAHGEVESEFNYIYKSMMLIGKDGTPFIGKDGKPAKVAEGIAIAMEKGGTVEVVGHSLGSALATYLTLDLADAYDLGEKVSGYFIASPRPGNKDFATYYAAKVKNYRVINYEKDVVPQLPKEQPFGYTALPGEIRLTKEMAEVEVGRPWWWPLGEAECYHHAVSYAAMLDKDSIERPGALSGVDIAFRNKCIQK